MRATSSSRETISMESQWLWKTYRANSLGVARTIFKVISVPGVVATMRKPTTTIDQPE